MLQYTHMTYRLTQYLQQKVQILWSPVEIEIVGSKNVVSPAEEFFLFGFR